jgi:hypothetical protein
MTQLSKIIDIAGKAKYDLDIALSVTQEAARYLDRDLNDRSNCAYLVYRQDDVVNLFSAAFVFLHDAKKGFSDAVDLLYDAWRAADGENN